MKQLNGIPKNIKKTIIGKITKKHSLFGNKTDKILVTNTNKNIKNYLAIITKDSEINFSSPNVQNIDTTELFEDDIVIIEPNGNINVVFDTTTNHNAILITEKCNSNCIMCPQPPVKQEENKFEMNLKFISLLNKNTSFMGITGGEPTLIGGNFFQLLKKLVLLEFV